MAKRRKITKGSISYLLKTNKISKDGFAPIFLRYYFKGIPSEYSIGKSIHPLNWDDESKEPIYISKPIAKKLCPEIKYTKFCTNNEVVEIVSLMNELELYIKEIENSLGNHFTSSEITSILRSRINGDAIDVDNKKDYFVDFIREYSRTHKGKTLPATLKVYNTINNMIENYENTQNKKYQVHEIDFNYIKSITEYMASLGLLNSTINRRLKHIKGFVTKARKKGCSINPTYQNYTWGTDDTEVTALTMEELKMLEDIDLSRKPYLERVRDVFLFACYTGLRYSDFSKLKTINIKNGVIRMTATKTKTNQIIPLSSKAKMVIEKYQTEKSDYALPVPSGQKFNEYIKEVCKIAGLKEDVEKVRFSGSKEVIEVKPRYHTISAHVARKTFVTLSLELGMKAEEIMPITGHKDYKSFKRYVNLTEKRAKEALLNAWEK